jgi:transcriptional repressor NrdR
MVCPFCKNKNTDVVETRDNEELSIVRRRRECATCKKRFTTYERIEEVNALVIKKDGRREKFDQNKLKKGIIEACAKTKVSYGDIEKILEDVTKKLYLTNNLEIESREIGELIATKLKEIDKVAYIRFASVFKEFMDVDDFKRELKQVK